MISFNLEIPSVLEISSSMLALYQCFAIHGYFSKDSSLSAAPSKSKVINSSRSQWRNRRGAECPPETSDRKTSADLPEKESRKKGKRVKIEKKRRKIVKGKVEN